VKISDAKALKRGDHVRIFNGNVPTDVQVLGVLEIDRQRIQVDVTWHDGAGFARADSRLHYSVYMIPSTPQRVGPHKGQRDTTNELNAADVPSEIVRCAIKVETWMRANGHTNWKLCGIQSRDN
jgi:hypothetical protein